MRGERIDNILGNTTGERDVAKFLADNPVVMRWAVCKTGGHMTYVLKEFPFGSQYKADFVVPMSYSGMWEVNLIELEPHDDMVITKEGIPSNRLNKAISQIHEWREYVEMNPLQFRNDLANWCKKKDLLGIEDKNTEPSNFTGNLLRSPETYIKYNYFIFIGKRGKINAEQRKRINQYYSDGIKIHSYGRVVDISKNLDRSEQNPNESIYLLDRTD
jgi:hypothetical protein